MLFCADDDYYFCGFDSDDDIAMPMMKKSRLVIYISAGGQFGNVPSRLTLRRRNLMQISRNLWRALPINFAILHIAPLFAK